ncbi:MAG: glycoside hydrolase [Verrucomicrobiaceae bacterium]|nr:glycoside hydrolase [Verrucomicrobiaceae bacterium]
MILRTSAILCLVLGHLVLVGSSAGQTVEGAALQEALLKQAEKCPKTEWQPMLRHLAGLHGRNVFPPLDHLKHPYESIGSSYQGGRVFGHIDLAHERLDTLKALPAHVRDQTRNELAAQQKDGLIPGVVTFDANGKASFKTDKGFAPLWVVPAEDYVRLTGDKVLLAEALGALIKQIGWFERGRAAPGGGFYYLDVIQKTWESGMDEGIRYDERPAEISASVDATAHVYMLYEHAARWCKVLAKPQSPWEERSKALRQFIQTELWDAQTGFFYDRWTVREPSKRHLAFEGMWPVVTGAATPEQARRVIDEHLLNAKEFFTPHPISTVAVNDSKFELRMWRGPAWNCMTYWAARGCFRYDRKDAAAKLLQAALDTTAADFGRTGKLWEYYHPQLGAAQELARKAKGRKLPYDDYIGHNPLFAMVALWTECSAGQAP